VASPLAFLLICFDELWLHCHKFCDTGGFTSEAIERASHNASCLLCLSFLVGKFRGRASRSGQKGRTVAW